MCTFKLYIKMLCNDINTMEMNNDDDKKYSLPIPYRSNIIIQIQCK